MSELSCPECKRGVLRRSERRGLWERHLLSLFGKYPWRCSFCRARLMLPDRGPQRHYTHSNGARSVKGESHL